MAREWTVHHRSRRWVGTRPRVFIPMGKGTFFLLTVGRCYVIRFAPYRGYQAVGWYPRGTVPEVNLATASVAIERLSVKKVKVSDKSSVKHLAALESEYFADVLPVVDALGMLQYEDGTPRQSGYLGIWVQGSAWVVRYTDKDADATLTAEGRTLDEALDLLALLLGADDAPWEPVARRKKKGG